MRQPTGQPPDPRATAAKRKVARLMAQQAMGWDSGENGRIAGGLKGLTIVVLKHVFLEEELRRDRGGKDAEENEDRALAVVERDLVEAVEPFGTIEKVTVFSKSEEQVIIIKFKEVEAADECVRSMDGRKNWRNLGLTISAHFWDGVTDYTNVTDEQKQEEEEKRHEDFGNWIDNQEVPEEFRPRDE